MNVNLRLIDLAPDISPLSEGHQTRGFPNVSARAAPADSDLEESLVYHRKSEAELHASRRREGQTESEFRWQVSLGK
jgi:hypothetical protein